MLGDVYKRQPARLYIPRMRTSLSHFSKGGEAHAHAASPKPAGTADDGQAAGAAPLASTGAGTGPAIAVAGLLAMAGASLLAAVARTRRHGADPDGLTAD